MTRRMRSVKKISVSARRPTHSCVFHLPRTGRVEIGLLAQRNLLAAVSGADSFPRCPVRVTFPESWRIDVSARLPLVVLFVTLWGPAATSPAEEPTARVVTSHGYTQAVELKLGKTRAVLCP